MSYGCPGLPLKEVCLVQLLPSLCRLLFPSSVKVAWLISNETMPYKTTRQQELAASEVAVRSLSQQAAWQPIAAGDLTGPAGLHAAVHATRLLPAG